MGKIKLELSPFGVKFFTFFKVIWLMCLIFFIFKFYFYMLDFFENLRNSKINNI